MQYLTILESLRVHGRQVSGDGSKLIAVWFRQFDSILGAEF